MRKLATLLRWELEDGVRLLLFALGVPALTYLLTVAYLKSQWSMTSLTGGHPEAYGKDFILSSITAEHFFSYPMLSLGFWILLSLLVAVLSVLAFRYDRERGYALTVYSLPYSKVSIFIGKLLSVVILSLLALYIPLFLADFVPNADIASKVWEIVLSWRYLNLVIFATYFVLFSLSVSVLFSTLLRDMFLAFMGAFFVLVLPFFAGLSWPPFSFLPFMSRALTGASPLEGSNLLWGLVIPAVLLFASSIAFTGRDVL
ncbi:ABC transporter permease subunit [Thermococcus sp. Bubb.Bath]|uniref:ABC transporter permease subunit n=1 Tax=Thermococcus sp. Bubb.Bath TaxID=1638242 RepID=UPI001438D20F|nr:ABC transporter permease subunit [Thermococcus sp. Bubb.Bath]NJF25497.1 hypothetical protein [Thermococcus sp. Bubb.Bath]